MNLEEFVNKIFMRYPPSLRGDDTEEEMIADYLNALESENEYDYESAFKELMTSYSFKTTPTAKILYEILSRNVLKKAKDEKNSRYPVFKNLWAFSPKHGHWYEFGIEPDIGEYATKQALIRHGFTQITDKNPRWSYYAALT